MVSRYEEDEAMGGLYSRSRPVSLYFRKSSNKHFGSGAKEHAKAATANASPAMGDKSL